MTTDRYSESGVSIERGDELVERLRQKNKSIGGFAGLYVLNESTGLVACTDGIGTKIELGLRFNRVKDLGQDLVAMCVNDLAVTGATPLFFLDYFATSKLDVDQAEAFIEGVREAAASCDAVLLGGETAEMPGFYGEGHFDAAGFAVGQVNPKNVIDGSTIAAGDLIFALPSSGFHSNGYSLIRKLLQDEVFSADDKAPGSDRLWKDVLTTPTSLYVNAAKEACKVCAVKGMAHITGGGLSNIDRVLPSTCSKKVDLTAIPTPEHMHWLADQAGMDETERFEVWNMGIGFVFVVSPNDAQSLRKSIDDLHLIGCVE